MARHTRRTKKISPVGLTLLGLFILTVVMALLLRGNDVILFNPKGMVATEQHQLMLTATLIMVGFAVPVLFFLYFFAWKYRESNHKAKHDPSASRSKSSSRLSSSPLKADQTSRPLGRDSLESSLLGKLPVVIFWGLPTSIMLILASLMIPATFKLEPQDNIASDKEPLMIQVVALRWKWLFIYPEQDIATVNYVKIPVDRPIQFELTADKTPMSSFWIPHLGGQLYAMTEHVNRLNLLAHTTGDYEGSAAEINGAGFAGMRFTTRVSSQGDFDRWVFKKQQLTKSLDTAEYQKLLKPSENNKAAFYSSPDPEIYSTILSKYGGSHGDMHMGHGEN